MNSLKNILFSIVWVLCSVPMPSLIAVDTGGTQSTGGNKIIEKVWRVIDGKESNETNDYALDEKILGRTWQNRMATLLFFTFYGLGVQKLRRNSVLYGKESLLDKAGRLWDKGMNKLPERVRAVGKYLPQTSGTKAVAGTLGVLATLLNVWAFRKRNMSEEHLGVVGGLKTLLMGLIGLYNPTLALGTTMAVLASGKNRSMNS